MTLKSLDLAQAVRGDGLELQRGNLVVVVGILAEVASLWLRLLVSMPTHLAGQRLACI